MDSQTFHDDEIGVVTLSPLQVERLKALEDEIGGNWKIWERCYPYRWHQHAFYEVRLCKRLTSRDLMALLNLEEKGEERT